MPVRDVFDDFRGQGHSHRASNEPAAIGSLVFCLEPQMGKQFTCMFDNAGYRLDSFTGPIHSREIRQPATSASDIQDTQLPARLLLLHSA